MTHEEGVIMRAGDMIQLSKHSTKRYVVNKVASKSFAIVIDGIEFWAWNSDFVARGGHVVGFDDNYPVGTVITARVAGKLTHLVKAEKGNEDDMMVWRGYDETEDAFGQWFSPSDLSDVTLLREGYKP